MKAHDHLKRGMTNQAFADSITTSSRCHLSRAQVPFVSGAGQPTPDGLVANSGVGHTMGCTDPDFTLCWPPEVRNRPRAAGSVHIPSRHPRTQSPLRSHSMASNPWIVRRAVWKD